MAPLRLGVAGEHRGERSVIADGGVYHLRTAATVWSLGWMHR